MKTMFCVEPVYLKKTSEELLRVRQKLLREHMMLEETIVRLTTVEIKGMDAVRRNLHRRSAELAVREREIAALAQALARISDYYSRTERKNESLFESPQPIPRIWTRIDLRDIRSRIPDVVLRYGTSE